LLRKMQIRRRRMEVGRKEVSPGRLLEERRRAGGSLAVTYTLEFALRERMGRNQELLGSWGTSLPSTMAGMDFVRLGGDCS
jgi:hypothetical protein